MTEDDIESLRDRVSAIEDKFDKLIVALNAGFGDGTAMSLYYAERQTMRLEEEVSKLRSLLRDRDEFLIELGRILGVTGPFMPKEALLRAAKRRAPTRSK